MPRNAPFDVVVYGATGFTGRQLAHWLARHAPKDLRWALAARNAERLAAVAAEVGGVPTFVADTDAPERIDAFVAQARVVANTAGPFARHGDPVVAACVRHATHYCDITGETPWVRRLIDRWHVSAAAEGTRIVPFCGFDSIPSDLVTLALVDHLRQVHGTETRMVSASFVGRGGFNGGTLASALGLAEAGELATVGDLRLLNPRTHRSDATAPCDPDPTGVTWDADRKAWLAPFFMAPINTRVVRRSAALAELLDGVSYGEGFRYREYFEQRRRLAAWSVAAGSAVFERVVKYRLGRAALRRLGPSPGEGPSEAVMDGGSMRVRAVAEGADGTRVLGRLAAKGDPGNRVTVNLLGTSALMLAGDVEALPGGATRGGLLTPASALGLGLLPRLAALGFDWSIQPL